MAAPIRQLGQVKAIIQGGLSAEPTIGRGAAALSEPTRELLRGLLRDGRPFSVFGGGAGAGVGPRLLMPLSLQRQSPYMREVAGRMVMTLDGQVGGRALAEHLAARGARYSPPLPGVVDEAAAARRMRDPLVPFSPTR